MNSSSINYCITKNNYNIINHYYSANRTTRCEFVTKSNLELRDLDRVSQEKIRYYVLRITTITFFFFGFPGEVFTRSNAV